MQVNIVEVQNQLFSATLTSCFTIIGGVLIFAVGQITVKFFVEPLHEQSKLIGEITDSLVFYADLYSNPGSGKLESMDEAAKTLRQQASQLIAKSRAIPLYGLWQLLRFVPKHKDVLEARSNFIGLSNSIHKGNPEINFKRREEVKKRLNIWT